jgi:membrane dipeptidase
MNPISTQAHLLRRESLIWDNSIVWAEVLRKQDTLDTLVDQGITVVSLKVNPVDHSFTGVVKELGRQREMVLRSPDLMLVSSSDDVFLAKKEKKTGITFSLADITAITDPLIDAQIYRALGVTHVVLSSIRNGIVDGCFETSDAGISLAGKPFIKALAETDLVMDGTMCGYRSSMEVMELTQKPFIFSHANPYAICPNRRNIRNDQIRKCAETGGVVGISFLGGYMGSRTPDTELAFRNIDHICQLVGWEHAALGSNFMVNPHEFWLRMQLVKQDGEIGEGECYQHANLAELVQFMLDHGYHQEAIEGILGMNWLRVMCKESKGIDG